MMHLAVLRSNVIALFLPILSSCNLGVPGSHEFVFQRNAMMAINSCIKSGRECVANDVFTRSVHQNYMDRMRRDCGRRLRLDRVNLNVSPRVLEASCQIEDFWVSFVATAEPGNAEEMRYPIVTYKFSPLSN